MWHRKMNIKNVLNVINKTIILHIVETCIGTAMNKECQVLRKHTVVTRIS